MTVYFVHNNATDLIVLEETAIEVTNEVMEDFLSSDPQFDNWNGEHRVDGDPKTFAQEQGDILAIKNEHGELTIWDEQVWEERLGFYGQSN